MNISAYHWIVASCLLVAGLAPTAVRAQGSDDAAARRQAILEQDQLFTDDGQIIEQDAVSSPVTRATFRGGDVPVQEVRWRRGAFYYGGRPYSAYYGRPRYYAPYPRAYGPYYGGYGYGYRSYYGPGYGYNPYYGRPYGAARVGPFRVLW